MVRWKRQTCKCGDKGRSRRGAFAVSVISAISPEARRDAPLLSAGLGVSTKAGRGFPHLTVCKHPTFGAREVSIQISAGAMRLFLRRSEEHTSELKSLMRISYAVFCLKKKNITIRHNNK